MDFNTQIFEGYKSDAKEVQHILNLLTYNDDCDEPEDEFDKLIYNVNLTINDKYNSKTLLKFARENGFEEVIRIALVLIYNQEISNYDKESIINSHTYIKKMFKLSDITEEEKVLIVKHYNNIYETSLEPSDFETSVRQLSIASSPKTSPKPSSKSLSKASTIVLSSKDIRNSQ